MEIGWTQIAAYTLLIVLLVGSFGWFFYHNEKLKIDDLIKEKTKLQQNLDHNTQSLIECREEQRLIKMNEQFGKDLAENIKQACEANGEEWCEETYGIHFVIKNKE